VGARSLIRRPGYRNLVIGRVVVYFGNSIAPVALAFAVLDATGSPVWLSVVVAVRSASNVGFLLVGGVISDRLPRWMALTGASWGAGLTQGLLALLVLTHTASPAWFLVCSAFNGAFAGISLPASAALIPQTVTRDRLTEANGYLRLGQNLALLGGAAAGGALVGTVGPGWAIALDALAFLIGGSAFARIRLRTERSSVPFSLFGDVREGLLEVVGRRWLWVVVVQYLFVNATIVGSLSVLGPLVADASFGRRAWGVAFFFQMGGLAVGAMLAARWQPRHALRFGVVCTLALASGPFSLGLHARIVFVAAALFLLGVALEQFSVAWDVSLQENVPEEKLGRVYSVDALCGFAAIPLGEVLAGPLSTRYGTDPILIGAGSVIVVATLLTLLVPEVRRLEREPTPAGMSLDGAGAQ
jgi:MFS family permease